MKFSKVRNKRRKIYNLLRSASILGSDVCWEPQTFGSGVCGMMWIPTLPPFILGIFIIDIIVGTQVT